MSKKRVVLRFFEGNISQRCDTVEIQYFQGGKLKDSRIGKLPANAKRKESVNSPESQGKIQLEEGEKGKRRSVTSEKDNSELERATFPKNTNTNPYNTQNLDKKLDEWLDSKEFENIKEFFISHANQIDTFIIESNQVEIKRLPWLCWSKIKQFCPHNIVVVFTS